MDPNILSLVIAVIGELPAMTEAVEKLVTALKDQELTAEQLAQLEAAEQDARAKWRDDLAEDAAG